MDTDIAEDIASDIAETPPLIFPFIDSFLLLNLMAFGDGFKKADLVEVSEFDVLSSWNGTYNTEHNATQLTELNQPNYIANGINGLPSIDFANSGALDHLDILTLTRAPSTSDLTIFIVAQFDNSTVAQFLLGQGVAGGGAVSCFLGKTNQEGGTAILTQLPSSGNHLGSDVSFGPQIYTLVQSGTNVKVYINGNLAINQSGTINTAAVAWRISGNVNNPPNGGQMRGLIGEEIVSTRAFSDEEREKVEQKYLSPKWKITI